jgi:hypothetical protein
MTEAVYSSESLMCTYRATRFHSTDDRDIQIESHKILKPRITNDRRLSETQKRLALNPDGASATGDSLWPEGVVGTSRVGKE